MKAPASPVSRALVQGLVDRQRALTRAVIKNDPAFRRVACEARDAAAAALEDHIGHTEEQLRRGNERAELLRAEVLHLREVVAAFRGIAPLLVAEAEALASCVVRLPDPTIASFEKTIETAIANGHAKRIRGDVVITYPGMLELARAADTRAKLERAQIETYELGRKVYEFSKQTNGAKRAGVA